jgi:hypothetical protein
MVRGGFESGLGQGVSLGQQCSGWGEKILGDGGNSAGKIVARASKGVG